uniref:NADH-ubiquinone oxidoreductase chain 3 n=1 Tax=Scolytinae sp. BMNH 1039905 TaxID=1903769 RepID=A0A343A5R7_9CUCU|nr:NADH dehydrogenase subunit 3 [Scolytinae sp. BMNH 1039905]
MTMLMIMTSMAMAITTLMVLLLNLTAKKAISDREKASPFECGFDPKNNARMPFSVHFFLIAIIFIIFDIELTLLLPLVLISKMSSPLTILLCSTTFIMTILYGLLHEMKQGSLDWTI